MATYICLFRVILNDQLDQRETDGHAYKEEIVSAPTEDTQDGVDPVTITGEVTQHEMNDVYCVGRLEEPRDGP